MIAFEVLVNGKKLCTAGVGEKGVLNASILGPKSPRLRVGGLCNEEHVVWISPRPAAHELKAGDEVTIRVVETDVADEPTDRYVSRTRAEREAEVKEHLEKARALLPESIDPESYHEHLSQNHLMGAMDVLEKIGESSSADAEFWKELSRAAHRQSSYEDSGRYIKRWKALESAQSNQE